MGLFNRQKPAFKMSHNPAQFLAELSSRKHWKAMNPDIFRGALAKAGPPVFGTQEAFMETARLAVFAAEDSGLLTGNLVGIADKHRNEPETAREMFSLTYYNFGSGMFKAGYAATELEQLEGLSLMADNGFMAAMLFNPFNLSAYAGMAFLYNCEYLHNFPVALASCDKYIAAEERLCNTPDSELSFLNLAAKQQVVNPTEIPDSELSFLSLATKQQVVNPTEPLGDTIRKLREELQEMIAKGQTRP